MSGNDDVPEESEEADLYVETGRVFASARMA
jgi:hypothetical protein